MADKLRDLKTYLLETVDRLAELHEVLSVTDTYLESVNDTHRERLNVTGELAQVKVEQLISYMETMTRIASHEFAKRV